MARRKIYIGSDFGGIVLYREDGNRLSQAPYVTLHSRTKSEYIVADIVAANGNEYNVTFTKNITSKLTPGNYSIEVFADESMANMLYYEDDFAVAIVVSPTNGESNISNN